MNDATTQMRIGVSFDVRLELSVSGCCRRVNKLRHEPVKLSIPVMACAINASLFHPFEKTRAPDVTFPRSPHVEITRILRAQNEFKHLMKIHSLAL